MRFKDRSEAALLLAKELAEYRGKSGVVIAIPRGGLPVGYAIAKYLRFPLDVALIKKIGHPGNKEYAIGSVSLHSQIISEDSDVSSSYIKHEIRRLRNLLKKSYAMYRADKGPVPLNDKIVIITDDGLATGRTMLAAIELIKNENPDKIVVAIPVAPAEVLAKIDNKVDQTVCLHAPKDFFAVGSFYYNFDQITDETAVEIFKKAETIGTQ